MKIEQKPITTLKPYPNNPRNNQKTIDKVADSIAHYGFRQPIVADSDGTIIVGHTRFEAAKRLGMQEVPVHVVENLNEAQIRAYRIADNRTAEESTWDIPSLKDELEELQKFLGLDLSLTSFNQAELAEILAFDLKAADDSDHLPNDLIEPAVAQKGDVWILGNHRVMCGDATKWQDVSKLMEHNKVDLIVTDPPYNVEYSGSMGSNREMMENDSMRDEEFYYFLKSAFDNCVRIMQLQASAYVCHASAKQIIFQQALEMSGFEVRNQIIWAKHHFSLTNAHYKPQHEPIFFCHLKKQSDLWYGGVGESTLWSIKKPVANPLHPTMKPLELVLRAIHNSSKIGDKVFDCFGGSGSTLIACESSERSAYLLEISPHYVDTIIRRWQSQTKQSAYLVGNGFTFEEIREEQPRKNIKTENNLCQVEKQN